VSHPPHRPAPPAARDPRSAVMRLSLLASFLMLSGKLTAYGLTGSAAMLSDAAESVVHLIATALAAFSLWYAARPADTSHPYGHGRIAYFSAGFEGALVFSAALVVIYTAVQALIQQPELRRLGVGLIISGALAVLNLALGTALVRIGRRCHSAVLIANGQHVLSDVWTTAAALVGVGLVMLTGVTWLDPLAALLIGFVILASGYSLIRQSFGGLMDEVDPELASRLLEGLRAAVREGRIADFHQVRCRRLNDEIWVEAHLLVAGALTTREAHARATTVERSLRALFEGQSVRVLTHVEPVEHEEAHPRGHELGDPLRAD